MCTCATCLFLCCLFSWTCRRRRRAAAQSSVVALFLHCTVYFFIICVLLRVRMSPVRAVGTVGAGQRRRRRHLVGPRGLGAAGMGPGRSGAWCGGVSWRTGRRHGAACSLVGWLEPTKSSADKPRPGRSRLPGRPKTQSRRQDADLRAAPRHRAPHCPQGKPRPLMIRHPSATARSGPCAPRAPSDDPFFSVAQAMPARSARMTVVPRAEFLGSSVNQVSFFEGCQRPQLGKIGCRHCARPKSAAIARNLRPQGCPPGVGCADVRLTPLPPTRRS